MPTKASLTDAQRKQRIELRKAAKGAKKRLRRAKKKRAEAFRKLQACEVLVSLEESAFSTANNQLNTQFGEALSGDEGYDTDE
jgi:hypothetical protein